MDFLPYIYLTYMFISIYFLLLFLLLYFRNKKTLFDSPPITKKYSVSVLVPAYNEEKTIENTIRAIFDSDYELKEVIAINDGSSDNTLNILKKLKEEFSGLIVINKKNSGKADSLNEGIKIATGELIAVVDADSYPGKDSFSKLVGFFDAPEVGVASPFIIPRNNNTFLEKLQFIEYHVIAFTRKLLGYVDAVYVTPGPLALYRKSALEEIGGFDKESLTEDIEATWHLTKFGYKKKICIATRTTTTTPSNFKSWFKQRRRWNTGGIQCVVKYKKYFLKEGMLGYFILPFFAIGLFLGLLGLSIFLYLIGKRILSDYLFVKYSIYIGTPILTAQDFFITPSFLNYLGIILFLCSVVFTILILYVMESKFVGRQNIFNLVFYFIFYFAVYPVIMISAIYHYIRGRREWR